MDSSPEILLEPANSKGEPVISPGPHRSFPRLRRVLIFPVKLLWGMLFCQGFLGSILVVGWTYRLAQRSIWKYWWQRRTHPEPNETFAAFLAASEPTKAHLHWPNWFAAQNFRTSLRREPGTGVVRHIFSVLRASVQSLWLNLRLGWRAILNTWLLTLPACLLWWFGWYDGWNNSFNKGYEQAAVGPLISVFGILWFMAAMFYVPMAQARQAATGEWRSFFQFRLVWEIARSRWLSCVGLALLYSLCALPLNVLKTGPMFSPQQNPALASLTEAEARKILEDYFFRCALVMLPAYVILRLVAARIYASGSLRLLQTGRIAPADLGESERVVLERLDLLGCQPAADRSVFVRFIAWTGTRLGRWSGGIVLFLLWFSFVAQIYIAEFFHYHNGFGWINQSLVQLPWFRYLPARLKNPWEEVFGGILLVLIVLAVAAILRALRAFRSGRLLNHEKASEMAETG